MKHKTVAKRYIALSLIIMMLIPFASGFRLSVFADEEMLCDEDHNNSVETFVVSETSESIMEAEDAKHFWPAAFNRVVGPYPGGIGSNGSGFVAGFYSNPGAYIEFPIAVSKGGVYILKVCYANGGASSPVFGVYLDDNQADKHGYAPVGGWGDWGKYEIELTLSEGEHSLKFVAEPGIVDAINVDYLSLRNKGVSDDEDPDRMIGDNAHNAQVKTFAISSDNETKMEAEDAKWFWKASLGRVVGLNTTHPGYSGKGFVAGFYSNPGAYIEYPINAEKTGTYIITVRYANGSAESPKFIISIDDTVLDEHNYAPVGGWADWGEYEAEIPLSAGKHSLKITAGQGIGEAINIDRVTLCPKGVELDPDRMTGDDAHNAEVGIFTVVSDKEVRMEAEAAKWFWKAVINRAVGLNTTHTGYSGDGFVAGFYSNPGAYIEYPIDVKASGTYIVRIRYANGSEDSPKFIISMDDAAVNEHDYAPVGEWGDWGEYEAEISLSAGKHSLKIIAGQEIGEAINIDYAAIRRKGVEKEEDEKPDPNKIVGDDAHNAEVGVFNIVSDKEIRMEAEAAKWFWKAEINRAVGINTTHTGYSGDGFVAGFYSNPGAYIEYPVAVDTSGTYIIRIRYANGSAESPLFGIYLDGESVDQHRYAPVGGWGDWGEYEAKISLDAGEHAIRFFAEPGIGEAINIDYAAIRMEGVDKEEDEKPDPSKTVGDDAHNAGVGTFTIVTDQEVRMEAENAKWFWKAEINRAVGLNTTHTGYSGDGFVAGFYSNPGAYIEYPIDVKTSGTYFIRIRYANGSAESPLFGIYLDGESADQHRYDPVGSWGNWGEYEVKISFDAGEHTLRILAEPGIGEAINIDYAAIRMEGVDPVEDEKPDPNKIIGDDAHNATVNTYTVPANAEIKIEAENAKWFWTAGVNVAIGLNNTHPGYSGDGFVAGFFSNPGAYIECPTDVQQPGTYIIRVRYANGSGEIPIFLLFVDDVQINLHGYESTGGWREWASYEAKTELTAGQHDIKLVAGQSVHEAINVDYIAIRMEDVLPDDDEVYIPEIGFENITGNSEHNSGVSTVTVPSDKEVKIEAEDAGWYWSSITNIGIGINAEHSGYSGKGFVAGFYSNPNAYLEFPLNVEKSGTYLLRFRYANGSIEYPEFGIYIGDQLQKTYTFDPIGNWGDWGSVETEIELAAGEQLLRIVAMSSIKEAINLDYITIRDQNTQSDETPEETPSVVIETEEHNKGVIPFVVSPNKESRFEAEEAVWYFKNPNRWIGLNTQYPGYSGKGFVAGFYCNPDAYIEYPLEVIEAGKYSLRIRYANGASPATFGIYIDDVPVVIADFTTIGSWSVWGDYTLEIELTKEAKSLKIKAEPGITDAINIDYISLAPADAGTGENAIGTEEDLLTYGTNTKPGKDLTFVFLVIAAVIVLIAATVTLIVIIKTAGGKKTKNKKDNGKDGSENE